MARQSAASLTVVKGNFDVAAQRPEPPGALSDEAKKHWRTIVGSMPADWFPRETHAMLTQLCRVMVRCATVAETLDAARAAGRDMVSRDMQNLMRVEMQLSTTIAQLSTKMRITQQSSSQYDKKRKRTGKANVPWDTPGGSEGDAG